jgi:hypothetical protein
VLEHPRDLMADFRAFYHLSWTDAMNLPAPEFFALAYRVPVYGGVMAERVRHQEENQRRNIRKPGAKLIGSDREDILGDSLLRDVVEME